MNRRKHDNVLKKVKDWRKYHSAASAIWLPARS